MVDQERGFITEENLLMLKEILDYGNKGTHSDPRFFNRLETRDGFSLSVIAGGGTYCTPRPAMCIPELEGVLSMGLTCPVAPEPSFMYDVWCNYPGPYTHVEVGFPSERPEPWGDWEEYCEDESRPTETVYPYVPALLVIELINLHGGEI